MSRRQVVYPEYLTAGNLGFWPICRHQISQKGEHHNLLLGARLFPSTVAHGPSTQHQQHPKWHFCVINHQALFLLLYPCLDIAVPIQIHPRWRILSGYFSHLHWAPRVSCMDRQSPGKPPSHPGCSLINVPSGRRARTST